MTSISVVSPQWLALRAAADDAARSPELAGELARLLAAGSTIDDGLTIHDLGSGSGAMTRWLAPRLPGPQRWVLHDGDAGILSHVELRSVADDAGRPVEAELSVEELAQLTPWELEGASAVTASAVLDVVTWSEGERIVAACVTAGAPALFSLTVTGEVRLYPADPVDTVIRDAFNAHQRRVSGGLRLLGPDAVPAMAELFAASGWRIRRAPTPWRLGPDDPLLIHQWLDGWVDAAIDQRPALTGVAEDYRRRRRAAVAAGSLRVIVSHEDVLAWPA
ncbi:SAM-dependent methyltransferase [Planctomonas sp. JC2975]|uniref:SAM-dependent methyltransferase n=1 Tax=Planctomonas sp. JC2975 TaxID=2729626 RepID=UPI0014740985|nr:SAM-dependent methyltransferase [Planctomonas sp. JC2975]NNC13609.1 SAM-dependent methyltransferase [Planctomonas sp. JC2975]